MKNHQRAPGMNKPWNRRDSRVFDDFDSRAALAELSSATGGAPSALRARMSPLAPGPMGRNRSGRDALSKPAGGGVVAKAGSKLVCDLGDNGRPQQKTASPKRGWQYN